jgi:hypothetical protein
MKITPGLGMTHDPLILAGEPGWPLSKFEEIGTYKATWQPSCQENKSAAGQGRGETTYHAEAGPPSDKWFLLEGEFNDDPSSITYWLDGEKVDTLVGGERADMVKFVWPEREHEIIGPRRQWRISGIRSRRTRLGLTDARLRYLVRQSLDRHVAPGPGEVKSPSFASVSSVTRRCVRARNGSADRSPQEPAADG